VLHFCAGKRYRVNFIIFDLEATCWQGNPNGLVQEIIEIGAFMYTQYGEEIGEYNRFVRPRLNPNLSAFCQELTGIEQESIDRARSFGEVIEEFQDWIGIFDEDYLLCSWGGFDRVMLCQDCALHQIESDWTDPYINLKAQYREINRLSSAVGLAKAVRREGLEFEGFHHRAIDDAANLARIFVRYLDVWRY
jgi:inhibitor of KinA sporulation pathway (predicted exonuclease)